MTIAKISYLRRLASSVGGHSKSTASRELTGLQPGSICPAETPEGKQCGNVEHLAAAAYITNKSYDSRTLAYRLAQMKSSRRRDTTTALKCWQKSSSPVVDIDPSVIMKKNYLRNGLMDAVQNELNNYSGPFQISSRRQDLPPPTIGKDTPLFLDGRPIGWVAGLSFRRQLIQMRREGLIHPHTGIHFVQKVSRAGVIRQLKIETTGGRIVQPLIIAEDAQKTVNMLWCIYQSSKEGRPVTISQLIEDGYIEFVDAAELEFLDLAPSVSAYLRAIQDGLPDRFDHIMLNPAFMMGIAANVMPFANMNPVVRNSYFTQMVKQPLDVPYPNFVELADTAISKLLTPQIPIVKTEMYDHILKNDYFGMNVKILIAPHREGEEDGIVVNERFVKSGGLSSVKYSAFPFQIKSGEELEFERKRVKVNPDGTTTVIEEPVVVDDPDRYGRGIVRVSRKVVTINPDGTKSIVDAPVIVKSDEVLASKTKTVGDQKDVENLRHESLRDGIVDRIVWSKSKGSSKMVYIIVKMPDNLWIGDKIASRYSQKGVIAAVVKNEDMPRDAETGETPDLIINPQAFPSRMTVGMLAEVIVANAHIYPDKKKNVPVLYEDQGFELWAPLERLFLIDESEYQGFQTQDQLENNYEELERFLSEVAGKPKDINSPAHKIFLTSEDVTSQDMMNFLVSRDLIAAYPGWESGIWALRFSGSPVPPGSDVQNDLGVANYIMVIPTNDAIKNYVPLADPRIAQLLQTFPDLGEKIRFGLEILISRLDIIPGLYLDTLADENDNRLNKMTGIKISELPDTPIPEFDNLFFHLGKSLKTIYIGGNNWTPVATQYVAGYRDTFPIRRNLQNLLLDFTIPPNMRTLHNVVFESGDPVMVTLPEITKFSDLQRDPNKIKIQVMTDILDNKGQVILQRDGTPAQKLEILEMTVLEAWTRTYPDSLYIPKELVIDLPEQATDIFVRRRERIEKLRNATIFKEGANLRDAMNELQLMGYSPDMKSEYINGKTGEKIQGGLVSGWSYYMPLKHKVKNKMQARGFGKKDSRNMQPIQGRNRGGGLRFNFMDALAVMKSGAANVVADRLLDAGGKTSVYVCTDCGEVCDRIGPKGAMMGSIVCRLCQTTTEAVKISVPYVFLLERQLLMGAGVDMKIKVERDDFESDE